MSAFRLALEQGANGLETDVKRTKDGVLVLFHDDDMMRLTGVEGSISDYTYEQLRNFEVLGGENLELSDKIPTLEEFLAEFSQYDISFAIELKQDGIEAQTVDMLNKYGMDKKRTAIISFNFQHLRNVRNYTGKYRLGYLIKDYIKPVMDEEMKSLNVTLISPRTRTLLDKAVVDEMHGKGYEIQSWGAYIEKSIKYTYDQGVDAMVVDQPDLLYKYMKEKHTV